MGKQYTFKTTKDTAWMEPILDAMSSGERSKFFRESVRKSLDNSGQTQVTPVSDVGNTKVRPVSDKRGTQVTPPPIEEVEDIEIPLENLESSLDNFKFV